MATTFESCNDAVHALLRQVMRDHHNALNANEVTIDAIFARRLDEDENGDEVLVPALKQHGYPVAGLDEHSYPSRGCASRSPPAVDSRQKPLGPGHESFIRLHFRREPDGA